MRYEFRLLGPVEMARDGQPIRLGPPKRKAMLVTLLLEANRPVPLPQLTAAMWAGPPPASAVANVRTHAAALRRLFDGRLLARPRAYELRVADGELDASEFVRLARAGREALRTGEPANAIAQLGKSLTLWRGSAGDGVTRGTELDARLGTLDEQRLDVLEDYLEARLHTGAYAEIAAELRRHLALWPMRERSWGLLIQSLYRAGNAAAALAAYNEARATLREQLGIEPGAQLQDLQRAVLKRDASLEQPLVAAAPAVARSGTARPAPATRDPAVLDPADPDPATRGPAAGPVIPRPRPAAETPRPPALDPLIGREGELAALEALLRANHALVAVYGPAGAGKSVLALQAAHLAADDFPDGVVQVSLPNAGPGPLAPADMLDAVLHAVGAGPLPSAGSAAIGERIAAYRHATRGRRLLLLLDGVSGGQQLRPLLGGPPMLVTIRRRPVGLDRSRCLPVLPLPEAVAAELLASYAGAGRTAPDPDTLRRLARACDGLPLALRICAERLARRPDLPAELLVTYLERRPLDGLRLGDLSIRDSLAAEHQAVGEQDPVAARTLPLLGGLEAAATITPEELSIPLREEPSRIFYALEELVDAWLAVSPNPGHYRTTGLVRAYAADLAPAPGGG